MAPDQGKGGERGCVNEEWGVMVSFWCSRRQRHLTTSERSVLESTEREVGDWVSCCGEWKRTDLNEDSDKFANPEFIIEPTCFNKCSGLRSWWYGLRSSAFWIWNGIWWIMCLTMECGTGFSKIITIDNDKVHISEVEPGLQEGKVDDSCVVWCQGCWKAKSPENSALPRVSIYRSLNVYMPEDFPGGSDGKASVYNAGDLGLIPGLGRSSGEGNGNPLQYYCLENPMDRGAW